jgi:hypothetical protein
MGRTGQKIFIKTGSLKLLMRSASNGLSVVQLDGLSNVLHELAAEFEWSPFSFKLLQRSITSHITIKTCGSFGPNDWKSNFDVQHVQDVRVLLEEILLMVAVGRIKGNKIRHTECAYIYDRKEYP